MKEQIQANSKNDIVEYIQFIRETEEFRVLPVEIEDDDKQNPSKCDIDYNWIETDVDALLKVFGSLSIIGHKISSSFGNRIKRKQVTLQLKKIE